MCFEKKSTEQIIIDGYKEVRGKLQTVPVNKDVISYSCKIDGNIPKGWEELENEIMILAKQQSTSKVPNISHIPDDKIADFSYPSCYRILDLLKYAILKASFPEYLNDSKLKFENDTPSHFASVDVENFERILYLPEISTDEEGRYYIQSGYHKRLWDSTIKSVENPKLFLDTIEPIWYENKTISPLLAAKSLGQKEGVLGKIEEADNVEWENTKEGNKERNGK